ncbi:GroES-like protein [Nemania serpens]|nr:GroES-like protein [Nemania serpens]
MPPQNKAAIYPSNKSPTLLIQDAPYPTAGPGEVIIRVSAIAINPVDHKIQDVGTDVFPFLTYPLTGGLDLAGTIVASGDSASTFRPGDRVLAFTPDFTSRTGAFQNYVVAPARTTSHIPSSLSFVDAAVLPSAVATAAVSLYQFLGLDTPSLPPSSPSELSKKKDETVLITAGASSVGSNAIQLAVASGYTVITTSSPQHFAHCTALGASRVFDYRAPDLASQIKAAVRGSTRLAGAMSCVLGSNALAFDVVSGSEGATKSVACTILLPEQDGGGGGGVPEGVRAGMIHAYWIKDSAALAESIYAHFLPAALAAGAFKCVPRPRVVGRGLEAVQTAFDIGKTGTVSCEKLVVTLEGDEA